METKWVIYAIINSIVFYIYGVDKLKAVAGSYRIPEKTLLFLAFIGPYGGFLGMQFFRHKIRKNKFKILIPVFMVIHLSAGLWINQVNATVAGPSSWASDEYFEAVDGGYITEDLMYGQQDPITREEFTKLIIGTYEKVMGEIVNITEDDNPFGDTDSLAVVKAYKMGIVSGTSATTFSPDEYVNREQMIVIFVRMNRAIEIRSDQWILNYRDIALEYDDIDMVHDWAYESFQVGVFNKLISGVGDNRLGPNDLTTKEQTVVLNFRLVKKILDNEDLKEYAEVVTNTDSKDLSGETGYVTVDVLNMRSTPDLSSSGNIIRKLKLYEEVELLDKDGEWYHVYASGNEEGYVYSEYIRIYQQDVDLDQSELVTEVIDYAKQFQGTPYLYAGTSLTKGIDCSGYTQKIFEPFGIHLNRSSSGQYSNGISITRDELEPGDLIFYGYGGRVSHVAIYIGNNKVIHANTTYGVSITDAFGWMHKPVIGYRRVIL